MPLELLKEYDTALDTKHRFTIRNTPKTFKHYHVRVYNDGRILMEPRVLVEPKYISRRTLKMMDRAMQKSAGGVKNEPLDTAKMRKIANALPD